jgi:tRNA threonylcarbamoyl adenosine modification protein YeaZ
MLADVLDESGAVPRDITDIAVGVGPGPFTGLRVGLVTARTTASVVGAAVHGVCSLDVIAVGAGPEEPCVVATDARRHEVHWARYDSTGRRTDGPAVDRPADLAARLEPGTPVVGRGAQLYADLLAGPGTLLDGPLDPDAAVLAQAVVDGRVEVLPAEPLYLRRPDARVPGPMKPLLPPRRW